MAKKPEAPHHLTYRGTPICRCGFLTRGMKSGGSCGGYRSANEALVGARQIAKHNGFDVSRIEVVPGRCPEDDLPKD